MAPTDDGSVNVPTWQDVTSTSRKIATLHLHCRYYEPTADILVWADLWQQPSGRWGWRVMRDPEQDRPRYWGDHTSYATLAEAEADLMAALGYATMGIAVAWPRPSGSLPSGGLPSSEGAAARQKVDGEVTE